MGPRCHFYSGMRTFHRLDDIYSLFFSQLDGCKDSLSLDGGFSTLIAIRLIRDN